jgi:hypothetical protein
MGETGAAIGRGVVAGLVAGVPQVLVVQIVEKPLGLPSDRADIGPRFVERLGEEVIGRAPSPATKWALAALFHFGYAAGWGALYGLVDRMLRPPPALAGALMGGAIFLAAFSRWGAGTRTRTEPHPDWRPWREYLLEWTAALTFSLTTAFTCARLRGAERRRRATT